MAGNLNGNCSSDMEGKKVMIPKTEVLDYEMEPYSTCSREIGENVASSSGGNLRAFFIGMGFLPSLVDKVIEENGENNADQLLETLFTHSALQKSNSSDSLDSLFDDKDSPEISTGIDPKEEPDELGEENYDKRASLLKMNFSVKDVEFAIRKLGDNASIPELVDFIVAAQISEKFEKETDGIANDDTKNQANNEKLFGTMEKTLQLLEMGFSESEVSSAIERVGTEVPISEHANYIFAEQNGIEYVPEYKHPIASTSCSMRIKDDLRWHLHGTEVKTENFSHEPSHSRNINVEETYRGKRVKEECDEVPDANFSMGYSNSMENQIGKRPKQEYNDDSSSSLDPYWVEEKVDADIVGLPKLYKSNPSRCINRVVAKPPYFFYGNIANIPYDSWAKISQFLYALEPEFVNTQFFSAVSRREGYVHNLPTENRFHILPKSPMTIEDAIPPTKKWWPSWDSRRQLSCINCETSGIAQHCERLGRILANSGGVLSSEQQKDILHHCRTLNLVWVGKYKLGPIEPEYLELILGYPLNHTRAAGSSLIERLNLLKYNFQTDTLGYHLSVLKPMFPGGLTMLSVFSGIGGAEVALHRLGIKIKNLVSVETSETKRKILKRWWHSSGQTGELVQIEDVQRLTSTKLENMIKNFGSFDLVICQNPCTSSSKIGAGERYTAFDFSLFYEFVRLVQRVRNLCERR